MDADVTGVAHTAGSDRFSSGPPTPCDATAQRVVTLPGTDAVALANSTSCRLGSNLTPASAALPAMDTSGSAPGFTVSVVVVLVLRTPWDTVSVTLYVAPAPAAPASCSVCVAAAPRTTGVPSRATQAVDMPAPSVRAQLHAYESTPPSGSYDAAPLSDSGVSPNTPPPPPMRATSGDADTKNATVALLHVDGALVKQLVKVNAAVWLLPSVRAGSASDGCAPALPEDNTSGVPLTSTVALVDQANMKPPEVLQAPSTEDTTPESTTAVERLTGVPEKPGVVTTPPVKLGVTLARSVHGAHVEPSPTMPAGHGPHVVGLVHATPV